MRTLRLCLIIICLLMLSTCAFSAIKVDRCNRVICPHGSDWGRTWGQAYCRISEACAEALRVGDDEVWVAQCIMEYDENVVLQPGLKVRGGWTGGHSENESSLQDQHPYEHFPTIDGMDTGPCVDGNGAYLIESFYMHNGSGKDIGNDETKGGGIYQAPTKVRLITIWDCTATYAGGIDGGDEVWECYVHDCTAEKDGGGLYGSGNVHDNKIKANTAGRNGGGAYDIETLLRNEILQNKADGPECHGGGVYQCPDLSWNKIEQNWSRSYGGGLANDSLTTSFHHNILDGNWVGDTDQALSGNGGGIWSKAGTWSIGNNIIAGNDAQGPQAYGGGAYFEDGSSGTIGSNTFGDNHSDYRGGALTFLRSCEFEILNNIFYENEADDTENPGCVSYALDNVEPDETYLDYHHNCYWWTHTTHGTPVQCHCEFGGRWLCHESAHDEIWADPLFEDYYHLSADSPCIDTGDGDGVSSDAVDIDGEPRIMDGDMDGTSTIDIGADEFPGAAGDVKGQIDDLETVYLDGMIVTAVFDDHIYVEARDRSCGIRVETGGTGFQVGDIVYIKGIMQTVSGERAILADFGFPKKTGRTYELKPVAHTNRDLGGQDLGKQKGVISRDNPGFSGTTFSAVNPANGRNNIGLLVNAWGKVVSTLTEDENSYVYIDDGSKVMDSPGRTGVRVLWPADMTLPSMDDYLVITGISGCYQDMGDMKLRRLLKPRSGDDILNLDAPAPPPPPPGP